MGSSVSADQGSVPTPERTKWAVFPPAGRLAWLRPQGVAGGFMVSVLKREGDVLGADLGNTDAGAVIFNIQERGLFDEWNKANPHQLLRPGLIITQVNGITGYWSMLEELRKPGVLDMVISADPPRTAGSEWFEEIEEMGKDLEAQYKENKAPFVLRLQPQDPQAKNYVFSSLPTACAGECGVDQCAICLEDVARDDSLVQLACGHAFHPLCAARWLSQANRASQAKRQCCPLCCRQVVCTANGDISTSEK